MPKFEEKIAEWMPLRLTIWRKGTAFFSPAERGAYMELILAYWELGPLPTDDDVLQQLARVPDAKTWRAVRGKVLAKFNEIDGTLTHVRIDEERTVALQNYKRKSDAGKVGGQASAQARTKQSSTSASSNRSTDAQAEPQTPANTTYQEHSPDGEIPEANASGTRKRGKPGSRISPDWKPTPEDISHAEVRNYSRENIEQLANHFRDYHVAKGTVSRDWSASWRTWIANDQKFSAQARGGNRGQQSRHNRPESGGIVDLANRLKARANLGGSGQRDERMGRGGDGLHDATAGLGDTGAGAGFGGIVLDADECERMHRPTRGTETPDEGAAGTGRGPGGPTVAVRQEAGGIPGGRCAEGADDATEHSPVVACVGGVEGEAGLVLAASVPADRSLEEWEILPDFLDQRHKLDLSAG